LILKSNPHENCADNSNYPHDDLLVATGHRSTGCRFIVEVAELGIGIGIGIGPLNAVKRW